MAKTAKKPVFSPNPTFAQVTPVIQGFDYNTGINAMVDENSIAGIGLLPDETHNAHPPQGYPWNGHKPPPGYPWEGHAPSSPNTGIEGLAPMRQGGPNFPAPAASTAYPQVDPTTGGGYPYAPTTQMGPPPGHALVAASFGSVDLGQLDATLDSYGATPRNRSQKSRTVSPDDYTYQQFADGSVKIIATTDPAGQRLIGTMITQSSDPARWSAITQQVGSWQEHKQGRLGRGVSLATQLLAAGTDLYSQTQVRKGGKRKRRSRSTAPAAPAASVPMVAPAPGIPGWAKIGGGVLGSALVLFVVYKIAYGGKE